jgi:ribosomal-protein-alanine N-acetyltransferase
MAVSDLDEVLAIEQRAYPFPWSRGNFTDSLAAGYHAQLLVPAVPAAARRGDSAGPNCLGYCVAMPGFEEMHLLNITVHPELQGQGLARQMLSHLLQVCAARGMGTLWLEVRRSNARAQALYSRWGFQHVGVRKGYYPDTDNQREDALVMRLPISAPSAKVGHALD